MLTATSLMPVFLLSPLGPGIIVIHNHHEQGIHVQKAYPVLDRQSVPFQDHDCPDGTTAGIGCAAYVLTLPDLPGISSHTQGFGCQVKQSVPSVITASILPTNPTLPGYDPRAGHRAATALRAHGMTDEFLLGGYSLLI